MMQSFFQDRRRRRKTSPKNGTRPELELLEARDLPESRFGDDPSAMLPDGRVLAGYISGPQTHIYDPVSNSWSAGATKLDGDRSDEETWVLLPDHSILSYNIFNNPQEAQRYVPA